jgi:putative hemolysin
MEILVILALIGINFFFALSEIAFISSKRRKINDEFKRGRKNAKKVLDFMNAPEMFLSSIQVGITLIGIISGTFGGLTIADDLTLLLSRIAPIAPIARYLAVVSVVGFITYFSIVLGELFPKTLALKNPEKVMLAVIPVMYVFSKVFHPIVVFLSFSTKALLRLFRVKDNADGGENPIKEIVSLARLAVVKNKLSMHQEKILYNTININKLRLHEIMVAIKDVKFIRTDMSLADAMIAAHIHHHTRYPLQDAATGEVVGYINLKDIYSALQINPEFDAIKSIARDILSFKDTDKAIDVLPVLMKKSQHIGLVRDSDRTVVGLITLEDIIESIVGDISDEYDLLPEFVYKITPTRFIIGGGIKLSKLRRELGLDVPDTEQQLAEWLVKACGCQPAPEKTLKYNNYNFIVRKIIKEKVYEFILQI